MISKLPGSDQRKIYLARKAVHVYKHFKAKYARATNLLNRNMACDDTYPPMVRVSSVQMWRNWKKVVVLLDAWVNKEGPEKFENVELLNVCIVVLQMMVSEVVKRDKLEIVRLDNAN